MLELALTGGGVFWLIESQSSDINNRFAKIKPFELILTCCCYVQLADLVQSFYPT
jgi:hypothetical protein